MKKLKKTKSTRKNRKRLSIDEQLQQQLQKIHRLKQQTLRFADELAAFEQEAMAELAEHEGEMVSAVEKKILKLAPFLRRKSLAQWKQHELIELLNEDLSYLEISPFCSQERCEELKLFVATTIAEAYGYELDENGRLIDPYFDPFAPSSESESGDEEDEMAGTDDVAEENYGTNTTGDMFEDFQQPAEDKTENAWHQPDSDPGQDEFEEWREQIRQEQLQNSPLYAIEQLFHPATLKTWFRKLNRILHPDRELDPDKKAQKHEQMIQLTTARDSHDVLSLLNLYQQHTGESPLQGLDCDKQELLHQLKRYAQWERDAREDVVAQQAPHVQMYYGAAYDESPAKRKNNYTKLKRNIAIDVKNQQKITDYTTSIAKLTEHLQHRYQEHMEIQSAELEILYEMNAAAFKAY